MAAIFERALPTIFLHEGRYRDHPCDPGGVTNYGMRLRFLLMTGDLDKDGWPDGDINMDGTINAQDVKQLTKEAATKLYRMYFWDKYKYEKIADQMVATKIFDLAINMGSYAAHKVAQRAVRAAVGLLLQEDGILGNKSFLGINMCQPQILLTALKAEGAGYYRSIRYHGSKDFMTGWLNRAYSSPILSVEN